MVTDMITKALLIWQLNCVVCLPLLCCFKGLEYKCFLLFSWEDVKINNPYCHLRKAELDFWMLMTLVSIFDRPLKAVFRTSSQDGSIGKHGSPPRTTTSKYN